MNTGRSRFRIDFFSGSTYTFLAITGVLALAIAFSGCKKNEEEDNLQPDFSIEYREGNFVKFVNTSQGDYYSLIWNFGNGEADTTTNKNKTYTIYYPEKGDYTVSLKLVGYVGNSKSTSKSVSIETTDLEVSFTAEIEPGNPNNVNLTNTTQGTFDSFKWIYWFKVVENEMEHQAYLPFAGVYEIELEITKEGSTVSSKQTVNISQDDPSYTGPIWADEFDYTGLPDPYRWNLETGGEPNWGNNELQYYTDTENNVRVDNGLLTITAREEIFNDFDYTSARITTQNKFDFRYGRIEARIKLPSGQGLWPAFWMLGANFSNVGWPACGEIDIMEMVGGDNKDNTVYATVHWENQGQPANFGQSYTLPFGIFADDFHIFSVEWDSQKITAYVDDIQYYEIDITPADLSEFQNNFFIILNVAVGGNWPGPPNASTSFPQTMEVDYVRVYKN